MSHSSAISCWEIALAKQERVCMRGKPESLRFISIPSDIMIYTMIGSYADLATDYYISKHLTCQRWYNHCNQIGLVDLLRRFTALSDYIREYLPFEVQGLPIFWNGFKHQLNQRFGKGPISSVLRRVAAGVRVDDVNTTIHVVRTLEQILNFARKCCIDNVALEQETKLKFLDTVIRVQDFNELQPRLPLLKLVRRNARKCVCSYLTSLKDYRYKAKHGPGATFETSGNTAQPAYKLEFLIGSPTLQKYAFYRQTTAFDCKHSKLCIVPKSASKQRTIAKETTARQWAQQAIKQRLYDCLHRRSYTLWDGEIYFIDSPGPKGINLYDDSQNRRACLRASVDGSWSTIDLSAASDSVSLYIFEKIFKGTWLYDAVLDTRSVDCDVDDGFIVDLPMVCTMGQATCFPVETVVFYAIAKSVLQSSGCTEEPLVYGDDIIVPTKIVDRVISALELYGFTVNIEKSFTKPTRAFREACGLNAAYGVEVTPVMLSKFLKIGSMIEGTLLPEKMDRSFFYKNVESLRDLSEECKNQILRSLLIRIMRNFHIPYYSPSRATFSLTDPNNLIESYTSVLYTKYGEKEEAGVIINELRTKYVRSVQKEEEINVSISNNESFLSRYAKSIDALEELRWYLYWTHDNYDENGFYVGPIVSANERIRVRRRPRIKKVSTTLACSITTFNVPKE